MTVCTVVGVNWMLYIGSELRNFNPEEERIFISQRIPEYNLVGQFIPITQLAS
jgi:hypothetical protein